MQWNLQVLRNALLIIQDCFLIGNCVYKVNQPKHEQLNTPHCQDDDYIINTLCLSSVHHMYYGFFWMFRHNYSKHSFYIYTYIFSLPPRCIIHTSCTKNIIYINCIYYRRITVHYIQGKLFPAYKLIVQTLYIYISKVELKVPCIYIIIENRVKLIKMHKKLMSTDNLMI